MKKNTWWIVIIVIVALVGLGAWVGMLISGPSPYAAVYLSTGDIYYGKLSWFPSPHLTDVWYLQRGTSNNANQLGIAPFDAAFWGPVNEIYLNDKQIIFWTYLRSDSPVAQALANPALFEGQAGTAPVLPTPQNSSGTAGTSTGTK